MYIDSKKLLKSVEFIEEDVFADAHYDEYTALSEVFNRIKEVIDKESVYGQ